MSRAGEHDSGGEAASLGDVAGQDTCVIFLPCAKTAAGSGAWSGAGSTFLFLDFGRPASCLSSTCSAMLLTCEQLTQGNSLRSP